MAKRTRRSGKQGKAHRSAEKRARTRVSAVRKGARKSIRSIRRAKPARGRVRVVRPGATRARARKIATRSPKRPLPPAEMLSERLFLSSLERSLRDNRLVWEALAKR